VSQPHTRKNFIAKVLGAFAATGIIAPRLLAGSSAPSVQPDSSTADKAPFSIKTDSRSVARSEGLV
jgi:hypothetical protein